MKKHKPEDIFYEFYHNFAKKKLSHEIEKSNIKVRGYTPKESDYEKGLLRIPNREQIPAYIDLFKVERKDVQVVELKGTEIVLMVVKTFERMVEGVDCKDKLIKTLKIYNLKDHNKLVDEILLEQIEVNEGSFNVESFGQISIMQVDKVLLFFRRQIEDGKTVMKLWTYDIQRSMDREKKN